MEYALIEKPQKNIKRQVPQPNGLLPGPPRKTCSKNKFLQSNSINVVFQFTMSLIISMVFSGCAKNIPSDKLLSTEIPEKKIEQLIKKAEFQLDYFGKKCISATEQCLKKKQRMLYILDVIEDKVSKINIDSSSMEMDDFFNTTSYLRDEINNLGDFSASIRETKDKVKDLKNELHELQANIDEICLVAEDESEKENTKFSLKKKIMSFMIQREMGIHAKNDFGL